METNENIFRTLLLVDNGESYLTTLRNYFSKKNVFDECLIALDGQQAIEVVKSRKPSAVLLDMHMPGMNGYQCLLGIIKIQPTARVIINSTYNDAATVAKMIYAGAIGYVSKDAAPEEYISAMENAKRNKYFFCKITSGNITPELKKRFKIPFEGNDIDLKLRQLDVMTLLINGYDNSAIASILNISEEAVAYHQKKIYRQTNTHSFRDLIKFNNVKKLVNQWWGRPFD